MTVWLGTSGWQYRDWRGPVYPPKLAQKAWLEHYVTMFDTVEVNNAFYRLPAAETFAQWGRRTPEDFVVVVKTSRYLTHIKRLKDPEEPVDLFVERAKHLGGKLGPVLLQLPPKFGVQPERLDATLARFDAHGVKVAVEVRDPSWMVDEVRDILRAHNAASVWADRREHVITPLWRTADWGYVRLHEGWSEHPPCYTAPTLDAWAQRIKASHADGEDVFVFFNNDPHGCAVYDAGVFARSCQRLGLTVTNAPPPEEHLPVHPEPVTA
ncbi:MAG TPA: DUF72 domain-containing protein [Mycobacteriales bacterium]|jgi:uncharacterized protein YecE (DUF72 family)|nr:DUF72 domain-containing protein [Mycobacteriales bacterium]